MNSITTISRELLTTASMKRYFVVLNVTLSASDILKLLDYQYEHEPGSNGRLAEDDAFIELEFLMTDLADGKVENATIQDQFIFITSCHVIRPCGFGQKLSIFSCHCLYLWIKDDNTFRENWIKNSLSNNWRKNS